MNKMYHVKEGLDDVWIAFLITPDEDEAWKVFGDAIKAHPTTDFLIEYDDKVIAKRTNGFV